MYCQKCGKQLNEGVVFCGQCGQRMGGQQPVGTMSDNRPAKPRKRGKGIVVTLIILALLIGGVFGGHFLGLYTLPFLTDSVNAVSILRADGTVNIERAPDTLAAREGMRLQNLDTVRTGGDSSSWLSLDETKAVRLSELTALRLDKGTRGFSLTLVAGEIKTQIDQPLAADEDFTVQAGNLALAVRGTVFTVNYTNDVVKVNVESGTVAVLDEQGNEIAVLGVGESGEYETAPTAISESAPTPPADGQGQTSSTPSTPSTPTSPSAMPDGYGAWEGVWQGNNVSYEGEWKDGKPNGYGVFTEYFPEGEGGGMAIEEGGLTVGVWAVYDGEWTGGLPDGQMTYTWHGIHETSGREYIYTYIGNIVDGHWHGDVLTSHDAKPPRPGGYVYNVLDIYHLDMGRLTGITFHVDSESPFYDPRPDYGYFYIDTRLGSEYATWPWD